MILLMSILLLLPVQVDHEGRLVPEDGQQETRMVHLLIGDGPAARLFVPVFAFAVTVLLILVLWIVFVVVPIEQWKRYNHREDVSSTIFVIAPDHGEERQGISWCDLISTLFVLCSVGLSLVLAFAAEPSLIQLPMAILKLCNMYTLLWTMNRAALLRVLICLCVAICSIYFQLLNAYIGPPMKREEWEYSTAMPGM